MAQKKSKRPEEMILCLGHDTPALNCIGMRVESNYYESWSPFSDGRVPFCKDCCKKMFEIFLSRYGNVRSAAYFTLQKMDIPFILEIWKNIEERFLRNNKNKTPRMMVKDDDEDTPKNIRRNVIGNYVAELHKHKMKKDIWTDFSATDVSLSDIDTKYEAKENLERDLKNLEYTWGKQDSVDDYTFLEETFSRYTQGITEFVNAQQKDTFRDLCRDRLLLRKINDHRYEGDETIDKIQNRIAREMSILKVDEFESNKPKTMSEKALAEQIRLIDEKNVADIYSEPSRNYDLNKVHQYEKDLVLRPLANMLVGKRDFDISLDDLEKYNLD